MPAVSPLPHLTSLSSVTSVSDTIVPFLHQFVARPVALYNGELTVSEFYHTTNPLITALLLSQILTVLSFVLNQATRNVSHMDRLWSVLPALYIGHFTYFALYLDLPSQRLTTLTTLACIWSVRLTYNFFRKGGYRLGYEDYRWPAVRARFPPGWFWLFDLTFIGLWQNLLLLAVALPAYLFLLVATLPKDVVVEGGDIHAFSTLDLIFSRLLLLALITEMFADQQQWNYQQAKKAFVESEGKVVPEGWTKGELERGFCVTGLWSLSRHPNFLAEQAFWVMIYQWSCFVTDTTYNYAAIGAVNYCMIFQGSTWLTEKLTASKYSEYADYQRLVGRFVPKLSAVFSLDSASLEPVDKEKKDN